MIWGSEGGYVGLTWSWPVFPTMVSIMRGCSCTPQLATLSEPSRHPGPLFGGVIPPAPLQIPFWLMHEELCLTVEIMPPGQASWMCLRLFWYKRHHLCCSSSSSLSRSWGLNPTSETGHMEWARRVTAQARLLPPLPMYHHPGPSLQGRTTDPPVPPPTEHQVSTQEGCFRLSG